MNLCIPKYHKYSYFFDQPVYFANEGLYFSMLLLETIVLALYYLAYLKYLGDDVWLHGVVGLWFNMVFLIAKEGFYITLVLSIIIGWILLVKLFHLLLMVYCILRNVTIDEVLNPPFYPYMYEEMKDENLVKTHYLDSMGPCTNILTFVRQALQTDRQLD